MNFPMVTVFLLLRIALSIATDDHQNLKYGIEDDLMRLRQTCLRDSCTPRVTDSLNNFTCQCGVICSQLGTCCIDSPYLQIPPPNVRPTCRSLPDDDSRSYFMVDHCTHDNEFRNLCEEEWNGDDPKKIVPVTSLFSFITYKNYFCFRCHETTDDFIYWHVRISRFGEFDQTILMDQIASLTYDRNDGTWVAPFGPEDAAASVTIGVQVPPEVGQMISECDPLVVSGCPRESSIDENLRHKCEAYMDVVMIAENGSVRKYQNMHCALCNSEDLSNVLCERAALKRKSAPFIFSFLLDTNLTPNEDSSSSKCPEDSRWDPYSKKCRKLSCALPGYVIKNGKCVLP